MTTVIHHQITVDVGDVSDAPIAIWFATHGSWPESEVEEGLVILLDGLNHLFTQRGWPSDLYDALYEADPPAALRDYG